MRVRVLRPICQQGKRLEPGTVLDLPDHEAREGVHRGVVERIDPAPAPSPGPMTTESAPAVVFGIRKKRKSAGVE